MVNRKMKWVSDGPRAYRLLDDKGTERAAVFGYGGECNSNLWAWKAWYIGTGVESSGVVFSMKRARADARKVVASLDKLVSKPGGYMFGSRIAV